MGELVHTSSLKNGSVLPRGFGSGTETQTGYTRFALLPSLCWIPGQPVSEIPGKSGQPTPGSPGRAARTDWTSRTCPDRDARDDRDAQTARQGRAARCPELPGARTGLPGVSLQTPGTVTRPGNPGQKKNPGTPGSPAGPVTTSVPFSNKYSMDETQNSKNGKLATKFATLGVHFSIYFSKVLERTGRANALCYFFATFEVHFWCVQHISFFLSPRSELENT